MTTTTAAPVAADRPTGSRLRWATLAICCLASMLLGIDNSVLNYAVPSLVRDLDPSATQLLWIADVYGFAMGGLLLVMGDLGDRYGRKRLMTTGAVLFGAASLATAYAGSAPVLIASRAVLGVAGAMILPSTLSLVRAAFTDPRQRTTAVGISSGTAAASFALGPVVGGLAARPLLVGLGLPGQRAGDGGGRGGRDRGAAASPVRRGPVGWTGSACRCRWPACSGTVYAVKTAARSGPDDPAVWIAAAVGLSCAVVFLRRQRRLAEPLLDLRLFRNRAFSGAIGANLVAIFASSTLSLAFSLYLQVVRGWSPLTAGLALLPGPLSAVFAVPLCTLLVPRIGRARVVALGLALMAASTAAMGCIGVASGYATVLLPTLVVNGCGVILTFAVSSDTVLAGAPRDRAGAAAAIAESAQEIGGALGIALLGSLLAAGYRVALTLPTGLPAAAAHTARESVGGGVAVGGRLPGPAGTALADSARHAFVHGLHLTVLTGAALLAVGAVSALFTLRGVPAVIDGPPEP